ncbi:MAG: LysR family transcriptional regulator [Inquilinus sp.]|nr:LysR family transcriptional regulator [Inquilinus sp.]
MNDIDWDNLRVFAAVARAGGLSAAATRAKQSPATLGRRIAALEYALQLRLFDRRRDGYALTAHGEALLPRALAAETAVLSIERWASASNEPTTVRVATGAWTGAFLAANAGFLAGISPPIGLEILSGSVMSI